MSLPLRASSQLYAEDYGALMDARGL